MRAILVVSLLLSTAAMAQVTKSTVALSFPNCTGSTMTSYDVDVYRPSGAGPFGLVGIGHGFQNAKSNHEVFARALAAKGIVVVVPQFPLFIAFQCGASDHSRNADILWAAMQQEMTVSTIDMNRLGLAGHSAGGLAAFLAASRHPVQALVQFDGVDQNNLGMAAIANVSAPTIFLSAEPSTCNSQNNSTPWFTKPGLKAKLKVVNATHCEPQDPLSVTCTSACGGTTQQARQDLFKSYGLAFFDRFLNGVTMPCLEATAQADAMAGKVANVDFQLGGCGATVDAGTPPVDAGMASDAGTVSDAGTTTDAGTVTDAGTSVDAGSEPDAGLANDAGVTDAGNMGPVPDAGSSADAGTGADGGVDGTVPPAGGCGCSSVDALAVLAGLAAVLLRRRRA